ncbi:pentatricopeptide repeat-containing protein At1g05670, mitochondrial-like [Setaria italica]|uniref:pentatricopeptide repeat-containing protein At1g05670, mitochondrial-like n=1 Tax=Setaria italica TaxID=4555 RepID=UPI000BE5DC67|nr:pentatricopeptide repeat-containing protein At1g05670, mitochondrial-like [Setaria italica]
MTEVLFLKAHTGWSTADEQLNKQQDLQNRTYKAESGEVLAGSCAGLKPNVVVYATLVDGFMREGNSDEAFKIIKDMSAAGVQPNKITYDYLIRGYVGKMEEAIEYYDQMLEKGVHPNEFTYDAFRVLSVMEKNGLVPDLHIYSSLISGLCKTADVEKAVGLLDEMGKKGVEPDGYCKAGDIHDAIGLYNEMLARGVTPDAFVYSVLTSGCSNSGDLQQALFITEEMVLRGYASISSFNALVHGFCKRGKLQETVKFLHMMMDKDIVPNMLTVENIVKGLDEAGKLSEAHTIFVELQQKKASQHDKDHLSSLFTGMNNQGLVPLDMTHNMIQSHCKGGDLDKALMLHDALVAKGAPMSCTSYLALLDGLCWKSKLTEAFNLLKEMEEMGICPSEDQCMILLNDLHSSGFIQEYNEVFDTMLCYKWLQKESKCNSVGNSQEAANAE